MSSDIPTPGQLENIGQPEPTDESDVWNRAKPLKAAIEQERQYIYKVWLPSGSIHVVALAWEGDDYTATCDCKGWQYRESAGNELCSHIATVLRADLGNVVDMNDEIVNIEDVKELEGAYAPDAQ